MKLRPLDSLRYSFEYLTLCGWWCTLCKRQPSIGVRVVLSPGCSWEFCILCCQLLGVVAEKHPGKLAPDAPPAPHT